MYQNDEWVDKASGFLTDLFDEVSKGFQKVADEIDKNYPNEPDNFETEAEVKKENPEKEEKVNYTRPPFGRTGFVGGARPVPPIRHRSESDGKRQRLIRADIIDRDDSLEILAVLPGFAKENLDVFVKGEELTITATKDWREVPDKEKYVTVEQRYGTFERTFTVGKVDASSIRACYKDGILHVTITKIAEEKPAKITIE